MEIRLRPLTDGELPEFVAASRVDYVDGLIRHARMPESFARDKAEHDLALYASATNIPEGHGIYWLEADGARVGRLWFAERDSPRVGKLAWLFELEVDEAFRGRGYGRQAMQLLHDEVKRRGLPEIALNVWGGNDAARRLYGSCGYFERSVEMAKAIE